MPPAPRCGLAVIHPSAERRPAAPSHPSLLPSPTPRLCLGPASKFCTFFTSRKALRLSRSQHTERSPCAPLWAGQGTRAVSHRPKGLFSGGLGGASGSPGTPETVGKVARPRGLLGDPRSLQVAERAGSGRPGAALDASPSPTPLGSVVHTPQASSGLGTEGGTGRAHPPSTPQAPGQPAFSQP